MLAPRVVSMLALHENSMPTQRIYEFRHSALAKTHCDREESERCTL